MTFERICVAGAGAIGSTLAARLAEVRPDVSLLARGNTLAHVQAEGIVLDDLDGRHTVSVRAGSGTELGPQDLVFLCCKAHQLPSMLPSLEPLLTPDTLIVPMLNGVPWWYHQGRQKAGAKPEPVRAVDPEGAILRTLDVHQVLGAVVFITARLEGTAHPVSQTPHLVMLGEPAGDPSAAPSPRLQAVCDLLESAGIEARAEPRIRDKLWTKIIANLGTNPLSVVTGATLEQLYTDPNLVPVVRALMHETLLVAAAHGARVEIDPNTFFELGAAMGAVETSMLQDYRAGRELELGAIGEAVLELAAPFSIPMPTLQQVLGLARFKGTRGKSPV